MPRPSAIAILLLVLAGLVHISVAWQIVEFCPDPYLREDADEYIVLEGRGPLDGLFVSDGEGSFHLPAGAWKEGRVTIAREGRAFFEIHRKYPDYELFDTSKDVPDAIAAGRFQMANNADELMLYQGSSLIQRVSWPYDVRAREGQVHYLENGSWDPRPLFLGQTRLQPITVREVEVLAFVSPDSSAEAFSLAAGGAEEEILVNVYLFTNPQLAEELARAAERGVHVRVLLDGSPVGGLPPESAMIACLLNRSGIAVMQMKSPSDARKRYRFDHAKYMVIDRRMLLVTSENLDSNGFPAAGERGNRGWGAVVFSRELAEYFADLFYQDASGRDIAPAVLDCRTPPRSSDVPYHPEFPVRTFSGANITAIVSPDTSSLVLDLLQSATSTIEIEQAYISNWSEGRPNPYLEAAVDAARRGVRVRILLDSYWFNLEGAEDNDEMVAYLKRIAAAEAIPLEARLVSLEGSGVEKIHNKGVIVDGRYTLVSSINWNENSPLYNREAGIIIESPEVARYFIEVFEDDWRASDVRPATGKTDMLKNWVALAIVILLLTLAIVKRRRRWR